MCNGGGNFDIVTLTNRSRSPIFEFDLDLHEVCHCRWFTGIKMQMMSKVSREAGVSEVSEVSHMSQVSEVSEVSQSVAIVSQISQKSVKCTSKLEYRYLKCHSNCCL